MHASFSDSPFSTAIPYFGATNRNPNGTEGNTNANSQESQPGDVPGASRCTIRVGRPHNKDLRRIQDAQSVTLVAAARSSNAGRKPSAAVCCHQEAFREYAFQEGIKHLRNGAEGHRRRGLQGSVWGRRARESAAMRKMLWSGQCEEVTTM